MAGAIQTTTTTTSNSGSTTNKGAIAGGVVGGVVGVALLGALGFLFIRKRGQKSDADREVYRPQDDESDFSANNLPPMTNTGAAPPPPRHSYYENYS